MINTWLWLSLFTFSWMGAPPVELKIQLYQRALRLVKQGKYTQANRDWLRLNDLFLRAQQRHAPHSRQRNEQLVGQCNILYHLAETQWKAGEKWASCHTRTLLEQQRQAISPRWLRHISDRSLPGLFLRSSQKLHGPCAQLPSRLTVKLQPARGRLRYRRGDQWIEAPTHTIKVAPGRLLLEVSAPGHRTHTKHLQVPRWKHTTLRIQLAPQAPDSPTSPTTQPAIAAPPTSIAKRDATAPTMPTTARDTPSARAPSRARAPSTARPVPARIARTTPPLKPQKPEAGLPFYRTWWFWTITGVVIAGGATAAIMAASLTTSTTPTFTHDATQPYRIPQASNAPRGAP